MTIIAHTGETAHDYFRRLRLAKATADAPEAEIEQARVGVVRPGRLLSDEGIKRLDSRSTPAQIVKRLRSREWEIRVAWAKSFVTSVRYVDDSPEGAADPHLKGEVRYPAHFLETLIILAKKEAGGGSMAMAGSWVRKDGGAWGFEGATTYDPWMGRVWRSSQLKPRPQRDWEKADGVPAPIGLTQWLKMAAPTVAELKKKQTTKEAVND